MKTLVHGKSVEKAAVLPVTLIISRLLLAITTHSNDDMSKPGTTERDRYVERDAIMREAWAVIEDMAGQLAERARLRTFVRSARGIVQAYATKYPKHIFGGHEIDPLGAHGWLDAEAAEVGTMRDGGDPKVEKRT